MTPERFILRASVISRLLTFIVTLIIGISLGQILPLRFWQAADANNGASQTRQFKRDCPRYR
jgi:hypothetical protein